MKKTLVFTLLFLVVVLSSCEVDSVKGINNFNADYSEIGLTQRLIPNNFLELFPYIDGDYAYREEFNGFGYETALIYMVYDESTYNQAKDYALSNLKAVDNSEKEYKGYIFLIRDLGGHDYGGSVRIHFAYSDEDRILLAFGTYRTRSSDYKDTSLEEYIEINFPFYDFEEGKINHPT